MQYDQDIRGAYADIFKAIRKIVLGYPDVHEFKNAKQTSCRDLHGVVLMMRAKRDHLVVAWGRGAKMTDKYPALIGHGKIVRHLHFKYLDELDETLLREMLEESTILGIERDEMKKLRGALS